MVSSESSVTMSRFDLSRHFGVAWFAFWSGTAGAVWLGSAIERVVGG